MENDAPTYLDGNAAGNLREVFAVDVTAAMGQCACCGATAPFARAHLYVEAPGTVARCAACQHVLLRLVKSRDHTWVELRGLTYLRFERDDTST